MEVGQYPLSRMADLMTSIVVASTTYLCSNTHGSTYIVMRSSIYEAYHSQALSTCNQPHSQALPTCNQPHSQALPSLFFHTTNNGKLYWGQGGKVGNEASN